MSGTFRVLTKSRRLPPLLTRLPFIYSGLFVPLVGLSSMRVCLYHQSASHLFGSVCTASRPFIYAGLFVPLDGLISPAGSMSPQPHPPFMPGYASGLYVSSAMPTTAHGPLILASQYTRETWNPTLHRSSAIAPAWFGNFADRCLFWGWGSRFQGWGFGA